MGPRLGGAQLAHGLDDGLEARELLAHLADPIRVSGGRGVRHQPCELVVAGLDLGETAPESRREQVVVHGLTTEGASPALCSASPAMASSSEATATSIMPWSGRRVVTRCSRRPGATRSP